MNKNIKIAKQLVKIARMLIADELENKTYIMWDENGIANETTKGVFDKSFNAKYAALSNFRMSKAVIYVSPDVNATNKPKPGVKGLFTRLHNFCTSFRNRLSSNKTIYKNLRNIEDKSRYTTEEQERGNYPLGCTIEKGKGVYGAGTGDGTVVENSYIVTVFGIKRDETEAFATALQNAFKQESVVVEYTSGYGEEDKNKGKQDIPEQTSEMKF